METMWQRFVVDVVNRLDGPMHFRFIVQPLMAIVFAVMDGLKDAKAGKPAYGWALFTNAQHRRELLKDGWKHFGKIFILAIVLDVIYQIRVHRAFYPMETLLTALVLAVVPYVPLRGPANRIKTWCGRAG